MHCATSRTVPESIPGGVTGDIFRGFTRRNHVPWGRLSPWKWVPGISPGVKAAGAYGWRPTTLVVLNVKKIRGLNLPWTPWATSACFGMTFTFICMYIYIYLYLISYKRNVCIQPGGFFYICFFVFSTAKGNSAEKRNTINGEWEKCGKV